jgi:hypothetical protein
MLTHRVNIKLKGVTIDSVYNFMCSLNLEKYQQWHFEHNDFKMIKGRINKAGSILFFDEYVGKLRVRYRWKVFKIKDKRRIVLKAIHIIPVFLDISLSSVYNGLIVIHELRFGFKSPAFKPIDWLIETFIFTGKVQNEMKRHVIEEFKMLEEIL